MSAASRSIASSTVHGRNPMPLSRAAVESVAALCGAVPDLSFTVTTATGSTLWVAEHPDARLCVHAFRTVVAQWVADCGHEPCLEAVDFDEFALKGGILSRRGERWVVSPLGAGRTAAALRGVDGMADTLHVLVREDLDFDVSVVHLRLDMVALSHAGDKAAQPGAVEQVLDDAAIAAYAACLTEELLTVSAPPSH